MIKTAVCFLIFFQFLTYTFLAQSLINKGIKEFDLIQINFKCDQQFNYIRCEKAKKAFYNAARIIYNTIDLINPIIINASFVPICKTIEKCPTGTPEPLGAARPSKFISLLEDDGNERLYAQALYKQLLLSNNVNLSDADIIAVFNSNYSDFWFSGDPDIGENQVDFEIVVLHEILHGLGFISSWDDYINLSNPSILTPFPTFIEKNDKLIFTGFREYALDRHLILNDNNFSLTNIANNINIFAKGKTEYASKEEFAYEFIKSTQYYEAKKMFKYSMLRNAISFVIPDNGEKVIMETNLIPYVSASSITHLDYITYKDSTDFLMRYKAPRKVIINKLSTINGNNSEYDNPIGPITINILKTLG